MRALAASDVVGVVLPASALFLGRPMPPARALVDAGAAVALATDFNPGSAFCESLPLCCSLAATQLKLSPAEALSACTVNAAHVLGRADRLGRLAPGYRADVVLLDAPDWRYLAYHLGGRARRPRSWSRAPPSKLEPCLRGSSGAASSRRSGTSTSSSTSTARGTSSRSCPTASRRREKERPAARNGSKPTAKKQPAQPQRGGRAGRTPPEPSWNRALKRGGLLGIVVFVLFSFTAKGNWTSVLPLALLYTVLFVPFTYVIDRFAYRRWKARQSGGAVLAR